MGKKHRLSAAQPKVQSNMFANQEDALVFEIDDVEQLTAALKTGIPARNW